MSTTTTYTMADLPSLGGEDLGSTDWRTIDQNAIDTFADLTDDHQWIHVDVDRAANESPYGRTIAHGYMTLGLLGSIQDLFSVTDARLGVNYGLNKVRFPSPVPEGSRIRLSARIVEVSSIPGGVQVEVAAAVEIEGAQKPACAAEALFRYFE